MKNTKRLTRDGYIKPAQTYQQTLTNDEIKLKLKDYKKTDNIFNLTIGTHLRYFSINPNTGQKDFRLGGFIKKFDPNKQYVILENDNKSWSAQIATSIFYRKLNDTELKDEIKKDAKKEAKTELMTEIDQNDSSMKKELKKLLENYNDLKKENKYLQEKNKSLTTRIDQIQTEIVKTKVVKKGKII